MKTLDEVIEALEDARVQVETGTGYWVDYRDNDELKTDALHYLKAFRDAKDTLEREKDRYAEAVKNCERAENIYKQKQKAAEDALWAMATETNDPLTWDELKQMDMQPVWYESLYWGIKTWAMVFVQKEGIYIDWYHRCQDGQIIKGNRCEIYKDQQGERWQAYRKERE